MHFTPSEWGEASSSKNSVKVNTGNLWVYGEYISPQKTAFWWLWQRMICPIVLSRFSGSEASMAKQSSDSTDHAKVSDV